MPMGEYTDFDDCVAQNGDKDDPAAYCGAIKHKVEGMGVIKGIAGLLLKQPRPGLVPQSGDPEHPVRWVRPEGEQQEKPSVRVGRDSLAEAIQTKTQALFVDIDQKLGRGDVREAGRSIARTQSFLDQVGTPEAQRASLLLDRAFGALASGDRSKFNEEYSRAREVLGQPAWGGEQAQRQRGKSVVTGIVNLLIEDDSEVEKHETPKPHDHGRRRGRRETGGFGEGAPRGPVPGTMREPAKPKPWSPFDEPERRLPPGSMKGRRVVQGLFQLNETCQK